MKFTFSLAANSQSGKNKSRLVALAVTVLVAGSANANWQANAQGDFYKSSGGVSGKTAILPIGTSFEGRIQSTIGSTQSRAGERFAIEISAPVLGNGTEVLIPTGAQIVGEVVEAIPSSRQPRPKEKRINPLGKLRTQLMSLQMPNGMSYPIVASISGDIVHSKYGTYQGLSGHKSSVGYVGTQAGFDAVNPALRSQKRNGQLTVMKREDLLRDPILGEDIKGGDTGQKKVVRSLVKKGRDLYIYSGSPITIRLDAPLKLSYGASAGRSSIDLTADEDDPLGKQAPKAGRRFNPVRERPKVESQDLGGGNAELSGPNAVMGQPGAAEAPRQQRQPANTGSEAPGSSF
ncbi:MAG TPA: hypothetical protein PLC15_14910 [Candidatus Obscuribacter sp.]|nr:hypothetical protein [Candidatus Obscuribacter sp.]MBK9276547.1 hypothetical protein [Candidatus Obscuribacter sp.]MBL8082268.1 hypothetical protein [Candidatus Obscuribacter sp.]HNB16671.1 hypothetical protein [Candidatus Obscuribacter sp.]HND68400.1 hypothetical protein [Candidatus Obscuribacter sp.]